MPRRRTHNVPSRILEVECRTFGPRDFLDLHERGGKEDVEGVVRVLIYACSQGFWAEPLDHKGFVNKLYFRLFLPKPKLSNHLPTLKPFPELPSEDTVNGNVRRKDKGLKKVWTLSLFRSQP